jgi:hypothetical protein
MSAKAGEETTKRARGLQARAHELQSTVRLTRVLDSVEDIDTQAAGLRQRVADVRSRGYVFEQGLEDRAADLEQQWPSLRQELRRKIDQETATLRRDLLALERLLRRLDTPVDQPLDVEPVLQQAERTVETLEQKAKAAADSIDGMYDQFEAQVHDLGQHLDRVERTLAQVAEASFRLLPTEAVIAAVRAAWLQESDDNPQGILFLTDQRLLFEQKQDIAMKKVLFITTEKERVQELRLDVPLAHVDRVVATRRGLLGHEDHLEIEFSPQAPIHSAHFHIDGQRSEAWQGMLGRAQSGDYDRDRAVPIDEHAAERVREAPSRCPVCNAPLRQTILRGMDHITCEYCGHVIRL